MFLLHYLDKKQQKQQKFLQFQTHILQNTSLCDATVLFHAFFVVAAIIPSNTFKNIPFFNNDEKAMNVPYNNSTINLPIPSFFRCVFNPNFQMTLTGYVGFHSISTFSIRSGTTTIQPRHITENILLYTLSYYHVFLNILRDHT